MSNPNANSSTDKLETEWIHRRFSFQHCPGFKSLSDAITEICAGVVICDAEELLKTAMRTALKPLQDRLRHRLETASPGLPAGLDARIDEFRRATRKCADLREMDRELWWLCGRFIYWHYSQQVIGKGGLGQTAVERQFGHLVYHGDRRGALLMLEHQCPLCRGNGEFLAPSAVDHCATSFECRACGHVEHWNSADAPIWLNKLRCPCDACRDTVERHAHALRRLSLETSTLIAQEAAMAVAFEWERLQQLPGSTLKTHPSLRAKVVTYVRRGQSPLDAIVRAFEDHHCNPSWAGVTNLFDDLVRDGIVKCVAPRPLVNFDDDHAVIAALIELEADVLHEPHRADWTKFLDGYAPSDLDAFRQWVEVGQNLLRRRIVLPAVFGFVGPPHATNDLGLIAADYAKYPVRGPDDESIPDDELRAIELLLTRGYRIERSRHATEIRELDVNASGPDRIKEHRRRRH